MTSALAEPLSLLPIDNPTASRAAPVGPGWFDSSWELRSGLHVKEGLDADLPLHDWLDAWLQAQLRTARRTASPSSTTAIA